MKDVHSPSTVLAVTLGGSELTETEKNISRIGASFSSVTTILLLAPGLPVNSKTSRVCSDKSKMFGVSDYAFVMMDFSSAFVQPSKHSKTRARVTQTTELGKPVFGTSLHGIGFFKMRI